eukprot:GFKZ01014708.1.p1 GENE.GFKZ01014708.1~~GFKZ01014708.1.p1  ORF type:complete len:148 (+),score=10.73 GFKZ01014708.1:328-771(+)
MPRPSFHQGQRLAILVLFTATLTISSLGTTSIFDKVDILDIQPQSSTPRKLTLSTGELLRFSIIRLAGYEGSGRGLSRYTHLALSMLGILGMFAAIVGALLGPCLADTSDHDIDEDNYFFWAQEDDLLRCGLDREQLYARLRLVEVP